jgi:phosphohistidine phosphatase
MLKPDKRTLFLVRHAKAIKAGPGIADIDRSLHDVGILEAYEMATSLFDQREIPQLIVSSTAARAISTALIFQRVLKINTENIRVTEKLYEIDVHDLFELVAELDDRYHSIMLVGQDPSFTLFSSKMDASLMHIPTGGVVRFDFEVEKWRHSSYINAEKKLFVYP